MTFFALRVIGGIIKIIIYTRTISINIWACSFVKCSLRTNCAIEWLFGAFLTSIMTFLANRIRNSWHWSIGIIISRFTRASNWVSLSISIWDAWRTIIIRCSITCRATVVAILTSFVRPIIIKPWTAWANTSRGGLI